MKQVYVLLARTQTFTSKFVHFFAPAPFTHTALALEPRTDKLYSYARRRLYNFLIGGIFVENTKEFVYARFPDAPCVLYELDVSDEAYDKIKAHIDFLMDNYDTATYNFLGMLLMRLGIVWKREKKFTCSQFVAVAISKGEDTAFPKDPYVMLPSDFLKMEGMRKIYEGKVCDCNFSQASIFKEQEKE